jgi:hypothetical protein
MTTNEEFDAVACNDCGVEVAEEDAVYFPASDESFHLCGECNARLYQRYEEAARAPLPPFEWDGGDEVPF